MTDQTDTAPAIGRHLVEAGRSFEIPEGDLDAVVRRGGHRLHRRRRGFAGLTALALVAGTVGAVDLLEKKPEVSVSSTGGGLVRGDVGIVWRSVRPKSGLGFSGGSLSSPLSGATAPLYALSTAPGQAVPGPAQPRVAWRSDDGVEWTAVSALAQDLYLSDLASRDGRVYAVGTAPATAAIGGRSFSPLIVGWSDDGAKTWKREALPIDLTALSGGMARFQIGSTAVASGPAGTVVTATLGGTLDVPKLLPAGSTAPNGWAITATGVDLLGPQEADYCPEGWSMFRAAALAGRKVQLQAGEEPVQLPAGAPPPEMGSGKDDNGMPSEAFPLQCVRTDGEPVLVSPQEAHGVVASLTWDQLRVDGDLLRAVRRQPVAFVAPPGSDRFERVDLPAVDPVNGPVLLDAGDDGFDLVTTTADESSPDGRWAADIVSLHSADGRAWVRSSTGAGSQLWAAAAGRVGGVATILGQGPNGAVVLRSDGSGGWSSTPLAGALAAGVPEGSDLYLGSADIGPFGILATVSIIGKEAKVGSAPPSQPEHRVLVSRDATTWEDRSASELAGQPVDSVIRASVVGERATVAVSVHAKGRDKPAQIVLVGTPS